ncbi:hypothetical protein [Elizabethkingia anophelis]|uniref:hypothetical protein n=1 Tax=Elizabethkingia anophelis TaxID=1117645 RepID=UPI003891D2C2
MEGKANEMFLDWITSKYFFKDKRYSNLNIYQKGDIGEFLRFPITKNAYIIEWLDSVKLNAYIVPVKSGWFSCIRNVDNDLTHGLFIDRESATEAAIKKAVEIYNEKYKNNGTTN